MADFTDCELADCKVGLPVKMAFRRRFTDDERGFSGYFWKAIPQPGAAVALPEIRFDGRVAIVTGAGAGLGRAYALELAKRGAKVVVNDYGGPRDGAGTGSSTPADKVVEEIKAAGGEAVANYDNVATPEGGEGIVKSALDAFGGVDILINNAGILRDKSFLKMDPENWQAVLAVHLNGAYNVTRPAFAAMREKGYGRIVMTTSAAGLYGNFGQTNYSAAKMGLVGFMNTLKLEGAKYNIRVNTIAPVAASRLTEDVMPPEMFQRTLPEFVAGIVLYLCSEECAATGEIFNAASGFFSRAAILTGPGTLLGGREKIPTPEDIRDQFKRIDSLEGAKEMADANTAIMSFLTPPAAQPKPAGEAAGAAANRRCRSGRRHGRQRDLRADARGLPAGQGGGGERPVPVLHLRPGRGRLERRHQGRDLHHRGGKGGEAHDDDQDGRRRFPGAHRREARRDAGLQLRES